MINYLVIGVCIFLLLAVIYVAAKPIGMGIEARRNIKDDKNNSDTENNNELENDETIKKNGLSEEIIKLNELKGMIESFSIQEEKFINEIYYVKLGVSFNKKKIYKYLEEKNIFPSVPNRKKFLFIPIIIDENKKDLLIFDKNEIFKNWNINLEKTHLIEYLLPTEDLEDLDQIKKNYEIIEQYDFKEITKNCKLIIRCIQII